MTMKEKEIKRAVKEGYARIAKQATSYYASRGCCGCSDVSEEICRRLGYSEEEIQAAPPESNLGLGCGNPVSLATIKEGEIVLDMGSGAGFDCFLASTKVGSSGKVIGVDITSEMVDKARANARKAGYSNIDFRQGDLENMPVADNYVDVVISNCVINLVPNKKMVFKEAFRVLKPGGRLAVSDVVLQRELPDFVKRSTEAYIGCLAGAIMKEEYLEIIKNVGFQDIRVVAESSFPIESLICETAESARVESPKISAEQLEEVADSVLSIKIGAVKPSVKRT
ncbi:MAG: arsenite S-adenosylmethyltransferase [Methanosaeta sp. PtaB.Bin018]|nr:MAG: arsenite S-adenosylmethyltransferase [Methanosaeta sp. PtaB.Bin018]OPY43846.1 MAG: arsenite S-adenosylmethyltransferase [Methanosaeta sp. PtaU1.Bin016]